MSNSWQWDVYCCATADNLCMLWGVMQRACCLQLPECWAPASQLWLAMDKLTVFRDFSTEQYQCEFYHITVLHIWVAKLAICPRKVFHKAKETSNVSCEVCQVMQDGAVMNFSIRTLLQEEILFPWIPNVFRNVSFSMTPCSETYWKTA